jgi:hypothetical protein
VDPPPLEQPATSASSTPAAAAVRATAPPRAIPRTISLPPQQPAARESLDHDAAGAPIVARSPEIFGDDPDTSCTTVSVHPFPDDPRVGR